MRSFAPLEYAMTGSCRRLRPSLGQPPNLDIDILARIEIVCNARGALNCLMNGGSLPAIPACLKVKTYYRLHSTMRTAPYPACRHAHDTPDTGLRSCPALEALPENGATGEHRYRRTRIPRRCGQAPTAQRRWQCARLNPRTARPHPSNRRGYPNASPMRAHPQADESSQYP